MALVVTLLLNWIMICLAHLRFARQCAARARDPVQSAALPGGELHLYRLPGLILVLMCTIDEMRLSAMLLPVWVLFLFVAFKLSRKK
jgi:phenylalanine-specific permease